MHKKLEKLLSMFDEHFVTTRPTTTNTLAWAVACEQDQWGHAIAGHVNVAPRHLTVEDMHVLGFDPHAFVHFRDERKRRLDKIPDYCFTFEQGKSKRRLWCRFGSNSGRG